jgi:hypothetical protein
MKRFLIWVTGLSTCQAAQGEVVAEYRPLGFGINQNYEWVRDVLKDDRIYLEEQQPGLLKLTLEGTHVCGGWLKVSGDTFLSLFGEMPNTLNKSLSDSNIVDGEAEKEVLRLYPGAELASSEVCWSDAGAQLEKKVTGQFRFQGFSYRFDYFKGELTATKNLFDISATIKAYPSRITSGAPTDYTVTTTEDGFLTDQRLQGNSYSASGAIQRYNEGSNVFDKSSTTADADSFYDQTASFLYGGRHFDFLKSAYEFDYYSTTPIQLIVGGIGSELNNAHFDPSTQPGIGGRIIIGLGKPPLLQNLGKDEDVISHEIGHYVIFKWIYEVSSLDSKILHEGLADFFVYDRTGDTCLGESICPGALKCVTASCLRVGNVDFTYGDATWNSLTEFHKKGQLIATALYNIRGLLPAGVAGKVAFKALSKVSPNSSIQQYVIALLHAEADLFASVHRGVFLEQLRKAGFSSWLVGAETTLPPVPVVGEKPPAAPPSTSSNKSKKWWKFGCTVSSEDPSLNWYLILLLSFPVFYLSLFTRRGDSHKIK